MRIDDLDRHLAEAGSLERAAVPLGMYMAWCGNLHLFSAPFQQTHELILTRLKYRDLSPAEFLSACSGGHLDAADLNEEGRAFTAVYYPRYLEDFRETFGGEPYAVRDDWAHYDRIAAVLTRRLMTWRQNPRQVPEQADTRRRWWRLWR